MTTPEIATGLAFAGHPWIKRASAILRWAFPIVLLGFVVHRLGVIGWREIWAARPSHIGFYLLLVVQFFLQPIGDLLVYANLWGTPPSIRAILRKRFLNSVMLDYSGELFFYFWARKHLDLAGGVLVHSIKDSNVLSAGAGLAMVYIVGLALIAAGGLPVRLGEENWPYIVAGSLPLLLCAVLVLAHNKVTVLSRGQIAATFGIHAGRSLSVLAVEFGLWELSGAMPGWVASLQFVALRLLVTRLPLLPNKDLIFLGVGIAVARLAHVPVAPVATVLVILAAADLILSSTMAGLPWAMEHYFALRKKHAA